MSRTTVIDIPLGDHAGKCIIEVPIAAAASTEHSKTISTITEDITSSIYRATVPAAQHLMEGNNLRKRQHPDNCHHEDEEMPVLDAHAGTDDSDGGKWVELVIRDYRNSINCSVKEHDPFDRHIKAYAMLKGMDRDILRFFYDGERLLDDGTAASMGLENGDVIDVIPGLLDVIPGLR
ncbi:Small ubiquitin-related modifier 2 [Elasticomyces elasticus]|nr:Small ubiquitin-related modifier 2 [Elasticomyces elasticus]KAK3660980.1 Small ubiquitin-related modifier 2 [Elasticomyces elasticus]KAK4932387.1 Small ubiquitin-related modifier 2 [Elasticomyces elasticus]KAK5768395.1 Small ubiquitin-related modifier 2 [Elasticomyces elasticus]